MRVHLLGLPNAATSKAYYLDGFAQTTRRFADVLKRLGATVYLYGCEENDAPCDEHIVCMPEAERLALIGKTPYQCVEFKADSPLFLKFNAQATFEIAIRKQSGDIIALLGGGAQLPVCHQHSELIGLEYSIGYQGVFAPYRIYQSQAWRNVCHGAAGLLLGRDFDDVIPGFFDVADFPFVAHPDPYVVFCGRLVPYKGVTTACQAASVAGVPLKVTGFGDLSLVTYGDYLGELNTFHRNELLAHAQAVLMPTQYVEPFGNVVAEAALCGTPVITTDHGAFLETIEHGVTGYRCHTLGEFVQAIALAKDLDRTIIRQRAERLYSLAAATDSYRRYFQRLQLVRGLGWHSLGQTLSRTPQLEYA